MPAALAFYRALGFAAQRFQEQDEYAFLFRDGLELHLRHALDLSSGVYFLLHAGTAEALEAEFRHAGIAILSPLSIRPWRMLEFVLSDPDGNLLRFGEPAI